MSTGGRQDTDSQAGKSLLTESNQWLIRIGLQLMRMDPQALMTSAQGMDLALIPRRMDYCPLTSWNRININRDCTSYAKNLPANEESHYFKKESIKEQRDLLH